MIMNFDYDDVPEQEAISTICIQIFNASTNSYVGTGFIVNSEGYFLSAGHNFKYCIESYRACFNTHEYSIEEIHKEHYYSEENQDLFIGRLSGFSESVSGDFHLKETIGLNVGDPLNIYGFNSHNYGGDTPLEVRNKTLYHHMLRLHLETPDCKKNLAREQQDTRLRNEEIKVLSSFCTREYAGVSGGPVYSENNIYGVCLADLFLPTEYILGVCEQHGISLI